MGRQVSHDVAFPQFGVNPLRTGMGQHPRRQIDPGEGPERQITDRHRDQSGPAPKVENRTKGKTYAIFG